MERVRVSILVAVLSVAAACAGAGDTRVIVRDLDDLSVLTPAEVAAIKATIPPYDPSASTVAPALDQEGDGSASDPNGDQGTGSSDTTIPLNQDNRPAELKLFDAYAKFKSCIEDAGETIRGNLQDPQNPAYQDPAYAELIQTCAARSKILEALRETSQARDELTPEQVEERNEAFKLLSECLKKRGWTVETRVDEKGLINPTRFESPDGTLDQRDLDQCLSETGINDAIEQND